MAMKSWKFIYTSEMADIVNVADSRDVGIKVERGTLLSSSTVVRTRKLVSFVMLNRMISGGVLATSRSGTTARALGACLAEKKLLTRSFGSPLLP
jgi:hypothetical protein